MIILLAWIERRITIMIGSVTGPVIGHMHHCIVIIVIIVIASLSWFMCMGGWGNPDSRWGIVERGRGIKTTVTILKKMTQNIC